MKKLLAITVLAITLSASAGVTNITFKVTVEIAGTGTNSTSLTYNQAGSNKDAKSVDGLVNGYQNIYVALQSGTNAFDNWLAKTMVKDAVQPFITQKAASDFAALKEAIIYILSFEPDVLNGADLTALQAAAAKK